MSTVYDRGKRDKQHYTSAEVTNVSVIHQCSYCFQTLKQLLHLSITLVPPLPRPHIISTQFTAPKLLNQNVPTLPHFMSLYMTAWKLLNHSIPLPPPPPLLPHHIPTYNCSVAGFRKPRTFLGLIYGFFSVKLRRTSCSKS